MEVRRRQRLARFNNITANAESGNRDYTPSGAPVTSPRGALYAMQVMPSTAHDPGFGVTPAANDSAAEYDRVGRDYRAAMLRHFNGDPAKMWAAYNAGPGAVSGAVSSLGSNWLSGLPAQTRNYVAANLRAAGGY